LSSREYGRHTHDRIGGGLRKSSRGTGRPSERFIQGGHVVLAAGAMASPHLLLASQLERVNRPRRGGRLSDTARVRHGVRLLQRPADREKVFTNRSRCSTTTAAIPAGAPLVREDSAASANHDAAGLLVESNAPAPFDRIPLHGFIEHLAGALVIAEDEPRARTRGGELDPQGRTGAAGTGRHTSLHRARRERRRGSCAGRHAF